MERFTDGYFAIHFGWKRATFSTKKAGISMIFGNKVSEASVVHILPAPEGIAGRGGLVRLQCGTADLTVIGGRPPPHTTGQTGKDKTQRMAVAMTTQWIRERTEECPLRSLPIVGVVNVPLIGDFAAADRETKVGGFNISGSAEDPVTVRACEHMCQFNLSAPITFDKTGGPTYFGLYGETTCSDLMLLPTGALQMVKHMGVDWSLGRKVQLIPSSTPRDRLPISVWLGYKVKNDKVDGADFRRVKDKQSLCLQTGKGRVEFCDGREDAATGAQGTAGSQETGGRFSVGTKEVRDDDDGEAAQALKDKSRQDGRKCGDDDLRHRLRGKQTDEAADDCFQRDETGRTITHLCGGWHDGVDNGTQGVGGQAELLGSEADVQGVRVDNDGGSRTHLSTVSHGQDADVATRRHMQQAQHLLHRVDDNNHQLSSTTRRSSRAGRSTSIVCGKGAAGLRRGYQRQDEKAARPRGVRDIVQSDTG